VVSAPPPASLEHLRPTAPAHRPTLGLIALAAGVIALAIVLHPRTRRAGRRIRRRWSARTPAARVVAAWQDAVDRLGLDASAGAHLTPATARALFPSGKPLLRGEEAGPRGKIDTYAQRGPHPQSSPPGKGTRSHPGGQRRESGDARDILTRLAERAVRGGTEHRHGRAPGPGGGAGAAVLTGRMAGRYRGPSQGVKAHRRPPRAVGGKSGRLSDSSESDGSPPVGAGGARRFCSCDVGRLCCRGAAYVSECRSWTTRILDGSG
jgi:hypothetical protein